MDTPSAEVQTGHVDRLEMVKAAARTRKLPREQTVCVKKRS